MRDGSVVFRNMFAEQENARTQSVNLSPSNCEDPTSRSGTRMYLPRTPHHLCGVAAGMDLDMCGSVCKEAATKWSSHKD